VCKPLRTCYIRFTSRKTLRTLILEPCIEWVSCILSSEPELSLLHCFSSVCNLFCVAVLLFCTTLHNSCIASGLVANCIGFLICNCEFGSYCIGFVIWLCSSVLQCFTIVVVCSRVLYCFTIAMVCSRLCAAGCSVNLLEARVFVLY